MKYLIVIFISVFVAVYCSGNSGDSLEPQYYPLRIVNGTDAEEGEFPYMVQLFRPDHLYTCGGAIIDEKWILTAGHCVDDVAYVVYGSSKLANFTLKDTKVVKVKKGYKHPKFSRYGLIDIYDLGLLEVEKSIPFSNTAKPLKLANSNDVPFHAPGVLAGWGTNYTYAAIAAPYLRKIELELLNDTECTHAINSYAGYDLFNSTHNICSDDHWNGECLGDSGSPFVINGLAYGTVSWSFKPCGVSPGTYSRITNPEYRSFIKEVAGI